MELGTTISRLSVVRLCTFHHRPSGTQNTGATGGELAARKERVQYLRDIRPARGRV